MALITFTNGTAADADDVNSNFTAVNYRSLSYDAVSASVTRNQSSGTGTTTGDLVTHAIGAGEVSEYIMIFLDYQVVTRSEDETQAIASARINIGETGSETAKITKEFGFFTNGELSDDDATIRNGGTFMFYYEPTTDEKTNGFNVHIEGLAYVASTSRSATATITHSNSRIMGR